MPVVEDAAQPALALVLRHDVRLDAARFDDCRREHRRIAIEHGLRLARQQFEQAAARDHSVLDHFVEAGSEFTPGQGLQQERVDDDETRLMEGTDQVLAERMVDPHLAAHRAVHLRQQRRRHVDERDPAQERRGREAGGVPDDPAAHRDDGAAAIGVGANQRVVDLGNGLEVLVALSVRQEDRLDRAKHALHLGPVQAPDVRRRHDEPPRADGMVLKQRWQLVGNAVADQDGRARPAGGDVNANGSARVDGSHDVNTL